MRLKECFLFDGDSGYFSYVSPDKVSIDAGFEAFEMTITKEPAQLFKYSIGYLDYNLNKFVSFKNKTTRCIKAKPDHLIYAKYLPFLESESNAYLKKLGSTFSFYDGTLDLLPVKKLWKTGILGCQMSGDLGPKLNEQLKIRCWIGYNVLYIYPQYLRTTFWSFYLVVNLWIRNFKIKNFLFFLPIWN